MSMAQLTTHAELMGEKTSIPTNTLLKGWKALSLTKSQTGHQNPNGSLTQKKIKKNNNVYFYLFNYY